MTDYKELVKALREPCPHENCILSHQAADAIEQLSNAVSTYWRGWTLGYDAGREESKPRWIPVTERLPEKKKYVLVCYKNNDMAVACWFDGDENILFWRAITDEGWCADCDTDPTHWMPLPSTEGLNET